MNDRPYIFTEGKYSESDILRFKEQNNVDRLLDIYDLQSEELYEILHPDKVHSPTAAEERKEFIEKRKNSSNQLPGNWIYFPWSKTFVHTVNEQEYFLLRTNRNKKLITEEEQTMLQDLCIAFAGLSIGSHTASAVVYSGIGKTVKLAEFDTLETTNLNRVKAGMIDIGESKLSLLKEQLYEINPYQNIMTYPQGLADENTLDDFISKEPVPRVIFEAIDDFKMKIKLRLAAREKGVPVVMFTNVGDNVMVDIERYDLDNKTEVFNGLLGKTPEEILSSSLTQTDLIKYAIQIVGIENLPTRILETFLVMHKELVGRPQLYGTVTVSGGFAPYLIRQIVLGSLASGRYFIPFHSLFSTAPLEDETNRAEVLQKIKEKLGL